MSRPALDPPRATFDRIHDLAPDDALALLEGTIADADDLPAADSIELDVTVVSVLQDPRTTGEHLEHIGLDALGLLCDRVADRVAGAGPSHPPAPERQLAWATLDLLRRSTLLRRISAAGATDAWASRILQLVEGSHFTFGQLLVQRAAALGERELFILADGRRLSWSEVARRVDLYARGLLAITDSGSTGPVAILSANRLEMALADFACLSVGLANVMIPATATEADVAFILEHSGAATLLAGSDAHLGLATNVRHRAPGLERIVALAPGGRAQPGVIPFDEVAARAPEISLQALAEHRDRVAIGDLATLMYTSGTTGTPKGIAFSQRNLVFKRFARALALPELGESDRFLAYLPLFHTFGRFLELQGTIFWGATYCFAADPSIDTLSRQMQSLKPTVFISIPMKWTQLYEQIQQQVDLVVADDADIAAVIRRLTGGRLRWGLSAAGHLDPEVFRFFQSQGIELMSGFGMTEATGGITMTPPGAYRDDSLGRALPGIELKLADDGELLVRGPYVMEGYFKPPDGDPSFDADGWLATGDLMERDADGFIRIVDRKKEIYKNVKGQTVAPQKIENLFRDFESVGRVFLVGDHRPYNTALIYPDPELAGLDPATTTAADLKAHLRSLVVTANTFLAPYERIVDFAVIDRDFSLDLGELTPKGTFRRKAIERNFATTISQLYRRTTLAVGGARVVVNNWIFQALGITAQDLSSDGNALDLTTEGSRLEIRRVATHECQVGPVVYSCDGHTVDLGVLLSTPRLWLGNQDLVGFAPLDDELRDRQRARHDNLRWLRRVAPYQATDTDRQRLEALGLKQSFTLLDLHLAALMLEASSPADALQAVRVLGTMTELDEGPFVAAARRVLRRAALSPDANVARRAFDVLVRTETPHRYQETIAHFLDHQPRLLDADTVAVVAERELDTACLDALLSETLARCLSPDPDSLELHGALSLLDLVASYGADHPSAYRQLRAFLTRVSIGARIPEVRLAARRHRAKLERSFRAWLGSPSRIAVDPETGLEYRWEDVVAFAEEVPADEQARILAALASTPLLREAAFLFSGGAGIRLADILPGGVWVRRLAAEHGTSVCRVAVRTRHLGTFDLAITLNRELGPKEVEEELDWMVVCGDAGDLWPLVEDFGGYWPDQDLWSEEFVPGETLDRALKRLSRRPEDSERLIEWWPFAAWSSLGAFIDFWNRTGRRVVVCDPLPAGVIVPTHDYHTGARLVSISARQAFESTTAMLRVLHDRFLGAVEEAHPELAGLVGWDIVFSALLGMVGEREGLCLLDEVLGSEPPPRADLLDAAAGFVTAVRRRGFLPRRLYFAAKRYRRWQRLNPEATLVARARTLQELWTTYGLDQLRGSYPETRVRFFRETVFSDAPEDLIRGLEEIISKLRSGALEPAEVSVAVADLRAHLSPGSEEDFFLAHLSFPHLRPEDEASFVATRAGDVQQSEMVVTIHDVDGNPIQIRHALNPKEVGRLHSLFLAAKLPVSFRPEHRFLVALSERGHLVGGLFYEVDLEERSAHMDKIVVAEPFRRKGVAGAILEELCNRLRAADIRSLTTGFFRPQFFYRFGFTVERRYAGLVRRLDDPSDEPR